jgi:hypothetical protein
LTSLSATPSTLSTVLTQTPTTTTNAGGRRLSPLMSLSVAGLGLLSLRSPFSHLFPFILANTDLQSFFCFIVFLLVFFIIAYLTNPSEASFRAYLTEQSFKLHLSRLDDSTDPSPEDSQSHLSPSSSVLDNCTSFHFANRASLSLRTPKHVFHTLGIFTIAAIVPLPKANVSEEEGSHPSTARTDTDRLPSTVADSWFIGAFGKWWRGGTLEAWYHDLLAPTKDENSWNPGVLAFKSSDKTKECNGLPFCSKGATQPNPQKLRHRSSQCTNATGNSLPHRSSTPPPLPKSASLPLHTTRTPHGSTSSRSSISPSAQTQAPPSVLNLPSADTGAVTSASLSRSPSALFEQSPQIAEVLRQISLTKSSVLDLRNQLTDAQTSASQTHLLLEAQVESCRERKRQEDTSRLDIKARTKSLEDSKRQAENQRKDAEKRLKATQHARDDAQRRISHLDSEIVSLRQRLIDDKTQAETQTQELQAEERELEESLEHKKREAKVAEDVVSALNLRARELEDKLAAGKEKLKQAKEQLEQRKQERVLQITSPSLNPWPQLSYQSYRDSSADNSPNVQVSQQTTTSPRPTKISLNGISNFDGFNTNGHANLGSAYRNNNKGYSIFDKDLASLQVASHAHVPSGTSTTFSPFDDEPASPPLITPTSTTLIPSSLVNCMENIDGLSRSFQSENDMPLEREWRSSARRPSLDTTHSHGLSYSISTTTNTSSPTSLHGPSASFQQDADVDPFEVRILPHHRQYTEQRWTMDGLESQPRGNQEMNNSTLYRSNSDPTKSGQAPADPTALGEFGELLSPKIGSVHTSRRWFSSREKPKKGLNPDAKVFSLPHKMTSSSTSLHESNGDAHTTSNRVVGSKPSGITSSMISAPIHFMHNHHVNGTSNPFDALNPNGLHSMSLQPTSTTTNSSILRAFAPLPEEREALQRAFGGSTNTSLERLPSLGSIPSSPTLPSVSAPIGSEHHAKGMTGWLQSLQLPLMRKPTTFSPWDDEATETFGSSSSSSHGVIGGRAKLSDSCREL